MREESTDFFESDFFPRWSFLAVSQKLWYNFLLFAGWKREKKRAFLFRVHIPKAFYSKSISTEISDKLRVTTIAAFS